MKISMIVAYEKNRGIGLNNKLLWHIPEDLKNFKRITSGKKILMGKNTFHSLPCLLPNREHYIISSKETHNRERVHSFKTIEECIKTLEKENKDEEIFIIGGAKLYNYCLKNNLIDKMYISEVDKEYEADTFIDEINFSNWNLIEEKKFDLINIDGMSTPKWIFKVYEK